MGLGRPARVALDIGGVISKYPDVMRAFAEALVAGGAEVHVITDMHDREDVITQLNVNGFGFIAPDRVHCADYATHGEGCKAELLASLGIDVLLDDFVGYVAIAGCPVRCLVMPDAEQPYWHPTWNAGKADAAGSDFGRRVYRKVALLAGAGGKAERVEWRELFRPRESKPFCYATGFDRGPSYRVEHNYEDAPGWSWRCIDCDFDGTATPCTTPEDGRRAALADALSLARGIVAAIDGEAATKVKPATARYVVATLAEARKARKNGKAVAGFASRSTADRWCAELNAGERSRDVVRWSINGPSECAIIDGAGGEGG